MRSTALATIVGVFSVILGIVVIVGGMFLAAITGKYNTLQNSKTDVETARANIETDLQRRFDLVPQLVGAVRGSMAQEQKVFGDIADARSRYATTEPNSAERVEAGQNYESAFARLLVVMENYPDLKSDGRIADLMTQLEGTENRISVSRTRYNEVVQTHNKLVRQFPMNFIAGFFNITEEPLFDAVEEANVAPTVDLESVGK